MNIMKINLFLLAFLLLFSCQSKPPTKPVAFEKWEYIVIGFHNIELKVSNVDSTVRKSMIMSYRKSSKNNGTTTYTPDIIKESIIKITSNEKDSIYKWSKKLIQYPIQPKRYCTDYAGKLFLDIQISDQITQATRYTSMCEWSTLSTETLKLNALFKQILK
jgi:hypothetical protein